MEFFILRAHIDESPNFPLEAHRGRSLAKAVGRGRDIVENSGYAIPIGVGSVPVQVEIGNWGIGKPTLGFAGKINRHCDDCPESP